MQPMGFAENQIKISKILPKPPIRLNDVPTGVTYCPRPQLHLIKLLIPLHSEPWFPLSYHHILFPLLGTTPPPPPPHGPPHPAGPTDSVFPPGEALPSSDYPHRQLRLQVSHGPISLTDHESLKGQNSTGHWYRASTQ